MLGIEALMLHRSCSGLLCRQEAFHQEVQLLCEGSVVSPALSKAFIHVGPEFITALDLPGFTGFHLVPDQPRNNQHADW